MSAFNFDTAKKKTQQQKELPRNTFHARVLRSQRQKNGPQNDK